MQKRIHIERTVGKISLFRRQLAVLDRDIAESYGLTVSEVKRRVRRNWRRFPGGSIMELTDEESKILTYQSGRLKRGAHPKYPPFAFTERGIVGFAGLAPQDTAVTVTLEFLHVFLGLRQLLQGSTLIGFGKFWHGVNPDGRSIPPYALIGELDEFFGNQGTLTMSENFLQPRK